MGIKGNIIKRLRLVYYTLTGSVNKVGNRIEYDSVPKVVVLSEYLLKKSEEKYNVKTLERLDMGRNKLTILLTISKIAYRLETGRELFEEKVIKGKSVEIRELSQYKEDRGNIVPIRDPWLEDILSEEEKKVIDSALKLYGDCGIVELNKIIRGSKAFKEVGYGESI